MQQGKPRYLAPMLRDTLLADFYTTADPGVPFIFVLLLIGSKRGD